MKTLASTTPAQGGDAAAQTAAPAREQGGPPSGQRRYELDWLRALAVFGLIPFHAAIVFTTGSRDYIKSGQTSALMDMFASFITFWGIPLLFVIGGAAARFALRARSPRKYVRERLLRLGLPFIVGVLAIVPIQVYVGTLRGPSAPLSYPDFYIRYLSQWVNVLHGAFPTNGADWVGHLWFIPPLLLFSLLALPFSRLLRNAWCARLFERAVSAASGWRILFVFGMPLAAGEYLLRAGVSRPLSLDFQFSDNWAGFVFYLIFFLYGYIIYADERLVRDVRRFGAAALALAVVSWIALQVVVQTHRAPAYDYSPVYGLFMLLRSYVSWFWVMAILGLGMRYLNHPGRLLAYVNEAAYPVYVLHMPVLTIVAFYIVGWQANLLGEFLALVVITLVVTVVLYDLLIRRIGVLRFLFGLRPSASKEGPMAVRPSSPGPGVEEEAVGRIAHESEVTHGPVDSKTPSGSANRSASGAADAEPALRTASGHGQATDTDEPERNLTGDLAQ